MLSINGKPLKLPSIKPIEQRLDEREFDLEILGQPRTVRLALNYRGEVYNFPLEVWLTTLIDAIPVEAKPAFFQRLRHIQQTGDYQRIKRAQVVAEIPMPHLDI